MFCCIHFRAFKNLLTFRTSRMTADAIDIANSHKIFFNVQTSDPSVEESNVFKIKDDDVQIPQINS